MGQPSDEGGPVEKVLINIMIVDGRYFEDVQPGKEAH